MQKTNIPSIDALRPWRDSLSNDFRPAYLLLYGIAAGRIEAGLTETLPDAWRRLTGREPDFVRELPGESLLLTQFAEVIGELRQAIDQYGEKRVLEEGFLQNLTADVRSETIYPYAVCRALTTWKTPAVQAPDAPTAVVFDNSFNAAAFCLAAEGRDTVVFTESTVMKSRWELAAKATGLPLRAALYSGKHLSDVFDMIPSNAECFLFGPLGVFVRPTEDGATLDQMTAVLSGLLSRTNGRICSLQLPSFAFTTGGLLEVRRSLIASDRLFAVIAFPSNMLEWTSISLLGCFVESVERKQEAIRFAEFSDDAFFSQSTRRRVRTLNDAGIEAIEGLLMKEHDAIGTAVPKNEILKDASLSLVPQKYLVDGELGDEIRKIESFSHKLGDIAEVIRPVLRRTAEEGLPVREVSASDITEFGRVVEPSKVSYVEEGKATGAFQRTLLRKGDIVYCIKGSVARCGLVVDDPAEQLTVGQMCVAIRLKVDAPISPVALQRYLRTETFAAYLKKAVPALSVQSRVAFMAAKDVENFPVPVLTAEQIAREEEAFVEQGLMFDEIERLVKAVRDRELTKVPEDWQ